MNKKQLAIKLSKLDGLQKFDVSLEQYEIDSNLASDILWMAFQNKDLERKVVADFGCGNGILGIGALLLGAEFVYFLDLDEAALIICKRNLESLKFKNFKLINSDVKDFNFNADTVIMNPPFGVQNRKADKQFLDVAMKHSNKIYSVHKIASKNFIEVLCKEKGFFVTKVLRKMCVIKRTYKFHTKDKHDFEVGIWLLEKLLKS